ncbi:uncharacterized protein LOC123538502 [Mercenaria mercenaria]|uniref:uncharacterized protein LOC123538502 n=1 Tax=Mercenaria mercenaria TaxID=6596 RepID=UPI00234F9918|nr:uncharacterized protein LOC123538502 [Mercenaria mercenaria]XP_045178591.2 uncharacterized protein LOC123538502 [Mercenaria mercenaria]XP_045178592.2 uncharacterized protein LOC123538502 [Mercenaria mercenaria]XP_045178594.2 uncharacterized protein LOC123538502 [Mercenaria mercenaria]
MSFGYYKKTRSAPPPNSYGFKQVSSKELQEIVKRVSKATYSAKLHTEEPGRLNNYEHLLAENGRRSVASACSRGTQSRVSSAMTSDSGQQPRRLTDREMSRLLRRLQRPTTATSAHRYKNEEAENLKQGKIVRAKSADVNSDKKTLAKLRRPTTATLAKTVNSCHLCYDHENKKKPEELDAFDYDYSDNKVVPAEELDFIVGRITQPTLSSCGGMNFCQKLPEYIDEVKIRENLPLLSGLRRSKNVNEITARLYPARRHHGFAPQATPIATY